MMKVELLSQADFVLLFLCEKEENKMALTKRELIEFLNELTELVR